MEAKEIKLDWENDQRLKHWLSNRKENTVFAYKNAFNKYVEFTGMTPEEMIQERWKDLEKKAFEQGVVEDRLRAFNKWLQEEYVNKKTGEKGVAPKSALAHCAAIADLYRRHKMPLSLKLTQEFEGATKGVNETEKMTAEQIEQLAYYAPFKRDKAIIWVMFQGGMDVSTVCSLNWGHIEKEIADSPLGAVMLRGLVRKKEPGKTFISFMYKTAVKHVKAYLEERFGKDYANKMEYDTPLFVGEGKWANVRYKPRHIQSMLRSVASDVGIAKSRQKMADVNPLRPHALRASFSDKMAKAGANKELIDFIQGHKLHYDTAYFGSEEGLREAYVKYAEAVLEPKRVKQTQELEADFISRIEELKSTIAEQSVMLQKTKKEKESKIKRLEGRVELLAKQLRELPLLDAEIEKRRADGLYLEVKELRTSLSQVADEIIKMREDYEKKIMELEKKIKSSPTSTT